MNDALCSIDGCASPKVARSWCNKHWKRWRKWGDPMRTDLPRGPAAARFWPKVDKDSEAGCWIWTAARDAWGYGIFRKSAYVPARAHRWTYEQAYGPIPEGMLVCHKCDNPPCVNPAHLFLGTDLDNNRDRAAKGRSSRTNSPVGENSWRAKLTTQEVMEIRARYAAGGIYYRELAEEYGVSTNHIGRLVRGDEWKHVA